MKLCPPPTVTVTVPVSVIVYFKNMYIRVYMYVHSRYVCAHVMYMYYIYVYICSCVLVPLCSVHTFMSVATPLKKTHRSFTNSCNIVPLLSEFNNTMGDPHSTIFPASITIIMSNRSNDPKL